MKTTARISLLLAGLAGVPFSFMSDPAAGAVPPAPAPSAHDSMEMPMPMGPSDSTPSFATAAFIAPGPLVAGRAVTAVVRLTNRAGKPITAADLEIAHTQKIHLLIIDPSLSDYHHEHPVEVAPGDWSFTFTPAAGGEYVIYADVVPSATHQQEYVRTTAMVAGDPRALVMKTNTTALVDGYRFDLAIPGDGRIPLHGGAMVGVTVTGPDGKPVRGLEPVMGAFGHGVGFTADRLTVLHVHPLGPEPQVATDRGGPELAFHLAPEKAGYCKFYVQVKIDGQDRFAPFGVEVIPP